MPKKRPASARMKPALFKLPPELLEDLADTAYALGSTKGAVVREAVAEYVTRHEAELRGYRRLRKRHGKDRP